MGKKDKAPETTAKVHCTSEGCKSEGTRFAFCPEHFEQFKFGLINKHGKKVPDYEKKFDHYAAYKQGAQRGLKVA